MTLLRRDKALSPSWWTLILVATIVAFTFVTSAIFARSFSASVPVTLTSSRTGLVMETGAKVKMRGVQVGRVAAIHGGNAPVRLTLEIDPDQAKFIPANVGAQIRATTVFGAKYVDLIYPGDPSPQRLKAGAVITSQNVSTEVNTVFENLTTVLKQIDPAKLNAVLSALAEGLRGQGPRIGAAITDTNEVLLALNPRAETMRSNWRALEGFSDTYSAAAQDILAVMNAASTTATTITDQASDLDAILTNLLGLARSGTNLIGPHKDNLIQAVNVLEPTTRLLMKYDPQLTCMLEGGKWFLDNGGYEATGGANGKSIIIDATALLGDDAYRYPDNLPIVGAKGGPGGKPSCGSLPIVDNNFPQRQLVTDTGWGTGMDLRPNPGIGFPGFANYFPVTRAQPEPPSVRYLGPSAPGPMPSPAAPPYGAPQYAPDGTPLFEDLPPPPPPGQLREPGPPPPGSEPFQPPPEQPPANVYPPTPAPQAGGPPP